MCGVGSKYSPKANGVVRNCNFSANVFHMKPNLLGHIDQRTGGGCHTARLPRQLLVRIRLPAQKRDIARLILFSCQTRGGGKAGIKVAFLRAVFQPTCIERGDISLSLKLMALKTRRVVMMFYFFSLFTRFNA